MTRHLQFNSWRRVLRNGRRRAISTGWRSAGGGVLALLFLSVAPLARAWVITRTSSPIFYIDTSVTPTLQSMYVAYQIRNDSAVSYPDVWAGLDSFTGGVVSLGPTEDGVVHLGALGPNQTKTAFFYLQASGATASPQSHAVRIYPTRPPASFWRRSRKRTVP